MQIIINERQELLLHKLMINEEARYLGDKEEIILKWLKNNFKLMDLYDKDEFGLPKKRICVSILDQNKQITDNIISLEKLFFILQEKYKKILSNINDRDNLIKSTLKKWKNNK